MKQLYFPLHPSLTRYHCHDNTWENSRKSNMLVPKIPYRISSPEEPLDCQRNITKSIDELCKSIDELSSYLNKVHERNKTMYNYMVAEIQNLKLQMHPQTVTVSDISLYKVTSQKKFRLSRSSFWYWSCPENCSCIKRIFQYWPSHITPLN